MKGSLKTSTKKTVGQRLVSRATIANNARRSNQKNTSPNPNLLKKNIRIG